MRTPRSDDAFSPTRAREGPEAAAKGWRTDLGGPATHPAWPQPQVLAASRTARFHFLFSCQAFPRNALTAWPPAARCSPSPTGMLRSAPFALSSGHPRAHRPEQAAACGRRGLHPHAGEEVVTVYEQLVEEGKKKGRAEGRAWRRPAPRTSRHGDGASSPPRPLRRSWAHPPSRARNAAPPERAADRIWPPRALLDTW